MATAVTVQNDYLAEFARRSNPRVTVIPTPPLNSQFYDHARGATLEQVRGIVQEYLAILGYWRRGWI